MIVWLFAGYLLLLAWLLCSRGKRQYVAAKAACSAAFVAVTLAAVCQRGQWAALQQVLPGLLFYALGDFVLARYHQTHQKTLVAVGTALFLVGHCWLIVNFFRQDGMAPAVVVASLLLTAVQIALGTLPSMHLGSMRVPSAVYGFAVSLLTAQAVLAAITRPAKNSVWAAFGMVLILVSDVLLLFLYFYDKKQAAVHVANLLTYYLGVFLLAASLCGLSG